MIISMSDISLRVSRAWLGEQCNAVDKSFGISTLDCLRNFKAHNVPNNFPTQGHQTR